MSRPSVQPPPNGRRWISRSRPPIIRSTRTPMLAAQPIERRAPRDPRPHREAEALVPGPKAALERVLAQLPLQVRQRDLDRTHDAALVAQRRRRRQVLRLLEADVHRREDRADRPRIHPAVGVPADVLVDGAVIHAGAAADAAQRVADVAAEHVGAAAVDDDEVHVLRAVELALALRARQHVDVVRDRLSGRRPRQETHQRRDVLERGHDLLDAGDGDVDLRQRRRQRRVALVGDEHDRAALRDEEVAAGDAHVGGEIVLPQHAARLEAQLLDARLDRRAVGLVEELGDLLLRLVQRRADDVRRRLVVVDLQDVLAEVGLDDRQARGLDRMVERRLLGDHRLRLDDLRARRASRRSPAPAR